MSLLFGAPARTFALYDPLDDDAGAPLVVVAAMNLPLTKVPIILADGVVVGGEVVLRRFLELANFEPGKGNRLTIFVVLICLTVFPNVLVDKIDILTFCKLFLASIGAAVALVIFLGGFGALMIVV